MCCACVKTNGGARPGYVEVAENAKFVANLLVGNARENKSLADNPFEIVDYSKSNKVHRALEGLANYKKSAAMQSTVVQAARGKVAQILPVVNDLSQIEVGALLYLKDEALQMTEEANSAFQLVKTAKNNAPTYK